MKRIILIITCLCNIPMLFSQHDISDYVKVIGVKYIDNVSVFDYYRKTSRHKMVGVCKIKLTSLITDSLYFYKLRNNIPLQGESFMDSALFDVNCFVYQDLPYRFVAEYILPCIKDTQYADTIKKTYHKYNIIYFSFTNTYCVLIDALLCFILFPKQFIERFIKSLA